MSAIHRRLGRAALALALVSIALASLPAAGLAAGTTVRITDDGFEPATLRVAPGTAVTWVNRSSDRHRVRTTSGPDKIDSGNLEPGERFRMTLRAAGTYAYLDHRDEDDARYRGRIVVASGSGESSGGGGRPAAASAGGGTAASTAEVGMAGRAFGPSTVTIQAGGTVTFRNDDDDEHSATSTDGAFDTGTLAPGDSSRQRFDTPGTFAFLCVFHSDMTGEIVVQAAAGTAPTPKPTAAPTPTPTPTPVPDTAAASPDPAAPTEPLPPIRVVDFAFEPGESTVPVGSTVEFVNEGVAPHTVTADDGSFDSGMLDAGATWSTTFDEAGTFAFLCSFHPDMTGTIEVVAATTGGGGAAASQDPAAGAAASTAPSPAPPTASPTTDASPASAGLALPPTGLGELVGILAAVLLIGGGMLLFGRTISGSVRRSG